MEGNEKEVLFSFHRLVKNLLKTFITKFIWRLAEDFFLIFSRFAFCKIFIKYLIC